MEKFPDLKTRILNTLDSLSPKHKIIARFILDNDYFTSFASASLLGEKTNTTAATIVRFAQALGYEGYTQLQDALRAEIPNNLTAAARLQKRMTAKTPPLSDTQQVFYVDIKNIERTANSLSESNLSSAVDKIINAQRILIIGAGLSAAPVMLFSHSLKVMGFAAYALLGEGLQSAVEIAGLREGDLMIAVDLWRYVRMTEMAVSAAKKAGIPVIAITDSLVSPLAVMAENSFVVATDGVAHNLSITALISLVNTLIAAVANRVPEQVYQALQKVDAAYLDNDLLNIK